MREHICCFQVVRDDKNMARVHFHWGNLTLQTNNNGFWNLDVFVAQAVLENVKHIGEYMLR